ncbi:hypothetical protein ACFZAM_31200 [Streptomyces sp. NPDC008079]|uniref:DUF7178 family protein n=1 Tax=Streptomyces sp. NPDC008079 TaxID=3364806 RepID=UPI0036EBC512
MLKFATAQIIAAELGGEGWRLPKTAHRAVFDYEPRPGYLYVRSRAISSRCNDNWDEFPADEIKKAYGTFRGKPVFVNHVNDNHRRARGVCIDAALHEDRNPDGTPDTWVEVLMEIDAHSFPRLAKAILDGHVDRTSMGCDVTESLCSACGNVATTPAEYCAHIPRLKGQRIYRHTASGRRVGELVREICKGLGFFENSILVEPPADPTAHFLGVDSSGLNKAASQTPEEEPESDVERLRRQRDIADRAFGQVSEHPTTTHLPDTWKRDHERAQDAIDRTPTGGRYRPDYQEQLQDKRERAVTQAQPFQPKTPGKQSLNFLQGTPGAAVSTPPPPSTTTGPWTPAGTAKEAAGPAHPNPADHPWFQQTPLHHDHVLAHWDKATDEERKQGARWYPDAHHVAKAIAKLDPTIKDDKEAAHKGAGVLSAYSPQQNWWANQHNAARSFVQGKAVGKGEGLMVMSSHANAAQRIMDGEDHQKVLKGPKTADFAHLIEHGGNDEKGRPSERVVVDRHALSVAAGRRLTSDDAAGFPTGSRHYYEHAAKQFRTAAAIASDREGRHIAPHEMQATTWLVRQRLNADADAGSRGGKGRQTVQRNQRSQWQDLSREHTPGLHEEPPNSHVALLVDASAVMDDGTVRLAYGEIKAPEDVDTLREEACPVCGDGDTYDGQMCQICGFISPPVQFRDPDLDAAKRMDLRKQVVDPTMVDDNGELQRVDGQGGPQTPQADDGQMPLGPDGLPMDPNASGLPMSPDGDQALDGTQHGPAVSDRNGDGIIEPGEIDAEGNPTADPLLDPEQGGQAVPRELPWGAQDHTGEPFTQGPDMPQQPDEPEGPDALLDETGLQGQEQPVPGTPGDGVPDLGCPACGFAVDATPPQTQNMDDPNAAADGIVAGDVCPNCQRAQLLSPGELQGQDSPPPPAVPRGPSA